MNSTVENMFGTALDRRNQTLTPCTCDGWEWFFMFFTEDKIVDTAKHWSRCPFCVSEAPLWKKEVE